ncbi:MAG TPA: glycerol-3-phosphate 1-O-acyltransferase PlsY [Tepidisphaeraceae bacterium]|jgi:glycerol-3-phosphate acyltransferase PlsY|nr:glycerol-3-phosphate 1-O-acyltransferase PlsY [Tepidisphaeraceae bacterium]
MSPLQKLLLLALLSYFLGSIPFGLLVGLWRGVDPRKAGSGNIGATNVARLLGGKYFALVFTLDLLKSLLPMLLAALILRRAGLTSDQLTSKHLLAWLLVGFAAILGHMFPIYIRFKGGKGVATSAGLILGLYPYYTLPAIAAIAIFLLVFLTWRYVSLASMLGAITFPIAYLLIASYYHWPLTHQQLPLLIFSILVAALIVYRHRSNIARLRAGTEQPFKPRQT